MKKGTVIAIASAGFLIILFLALYAFNSNKTAAKKQLNIAQAKVLRGNIEVSVSGTGTLVPIEVRDISPKIAGTVKKIYVKNGDTVKQDDVIAEFENDQEVKAPADGIISGLNITEGEEFVGRTTSAPQQISSPQNQLSNTTITDTKSFGKVMNIESMLVIFPVDEVDIFKIKTGQEASISIDAMPEKNFKGKVTEVSEEGIVQNNVGTFDVTIEVSNPENILKSGLTSNVTVVAERKANVLLIPIEALQQSGQQKYVLVATAEGASNKSSVEVGLTNETYAEITKGLNEGEKILLPSLVEDTPQTGMGARGPFSRNSTNR